MNPFLFRITLIAFCLALTVTPLLKAQSGLDIDPNRVTVSGLSAGGAMANQLHIAYSDVFSGAGIIAGVPFGCADNSLGTALARCMGKTDGNLAANETVASLEIAQANGQIADLANLQNDPVWLFHGTQDQVVAEAVSDALYKLYLELAPAEQIQYVKDIEAAHH
ncbi:MAG TPA: PHB depolymerase family esterase, partial [Xanthomonadales bacterium]|nr:PHB depolymerase family esterase [Xanthomonadales bacterium]